MLRMAVLVGGLFFVMSAECARASEPRHRPELVMVALSGHLLTGNTPERFRPDDVRAWVGCIRRTAFCSARGGNVAVSPGERRSLESCPRH